MQQPRVRALRLLDAAGQMLHIGDRATLSFIDRLYLYRLPVEDQDVYETWLGQTVVVADVDDCGTVAINRHDAAPGRPQFWIDPRWLLRLPV